MQLSAIRFHAALFTALVAAFATTNCSADWINLTGAEVSPNIAELYVEDDHVNVVLEIYVGDLKEFEELVPDDWQNEADVDRAPADERIRDFAERTFRIEGPDGQALPARIERVEPRMRIDRASPFAGMINPYTKRRTATAPEDKRVLYAELTYPFDGRPERLTFIPPLDSEGRPVVSIGFIAYHKSVPVIDFRYLGAPSVLELDWEDPWYSKFTNPTLKRHHKDAMMSFLYVEPFEVRHEILTRVKDMADWMDLGLRGDEFIETDELEPLKRQIGEFLAENNPVLIDGKAVSPILDRTNYIKVGIKGIQFLEVPERLEISTAIVGVILAFVTDGLPQEVTVEWELFSDRIGRVPATAIDPAGPFASYVEPEANVHTWTNFLKKYEIPTVAPTTVSGTLPDLQIPAGMFVCLVALVPTLVWLRRRSRSGATPAPPVVTAIVLLMLSGVAFQSGPYVAVSRPDVLPPELGKERTKAIVESLLRNVYRSFDFREESDVYDKLRTSVSGDLLADVYLQSRRSLLIEQAGGAQARVISVDVSSVETSGPIDRQLAYDVRARWTTAGSVGHWGHIHRRENAYEADLRIEAEASNWKLAGLELLEERRIDPAAGTRAEPKTANGDTK
jgi:hypothetical protein